MSVYALLYDSTGGALLIALDTDVHLLTQAEAEAFEKNANEFVIHRVRVAIPHQNDTRLKHAMETGAACARHMLEACHLAEDPHGVFVWWTFDTIRPIEDESAGLLGACAFAVARLQQVQPDFAPVAFAATGRVTSSGRVQRVAHLPEKLRTALASTPPLRLVLYPKDQAADVQDLVAQASHQHDTMFCPVATVDEALAILLQMGHPADSVPQAEPPSRAKPVLAKTPDWPEETSQAPAPTRRQVFLPKARLLLVGFCLGILATWLVGRFVWLTPPPPPSPPPLPPPLWNSLGMAFRWLPAGMFTMGSPHGQPDEQPVHRVEISQPFYLGTYEVTLGQWQALMGPHPAQQFTASLDLPVDSVSWDDIQAFIARLHARGQERGLTYRLPTEAEWEYAARAEVARATSIREDLRYLQTVAWCAPNAGNQTHLGGKRQANAWGLHDMQGNVAEWVQDWYHASYPEATGPHAVDPRGPPNGTARVVRGGSWYDPAGECRVTARQHAPPGDRHRKRGFRLLLTPVRP